MFHYTRDLKVNEMTRELPLMHSVAPQGARGGSLCVVDSLRGRGRSDYACLCVWPASL